MGKHSTGSAGGCKLDSKNRRTGCNKGNPNVPDSEKSETCGPPSVGDKKANGTGKRERSGSGGGGKCAFGSSKGCNNDRTKEQGYGKKKSGGDETCGVGPRDISGAYKDEENGRGFIGTQTRDVNNTKTGCDIAGYGPLKPRHKGGVVDPSGSDQREGQGYGYERGQGHGNGPNRGSDYYAQNKNQNQNGRNSSSDYNGHAQDKYQNQNQNQNQNQGKRRGSFDDDSRRNPDNPDESGSALAQKRNKAVGDSLVTEKEVCVPLPTPAPKSTHTIGTDPEIQVLSKHAYENEPGSDSNRTYAQANEFTDTSDLRIPSAHAPMPVSQRNFSKSQHSPSQAPGAVSPRILAKSQHADSSHSPANASQLVSQGKLSKLQQGPGRGSEAVHESPNTSLLYAHPYTTSPSSVQPSVAPPGSKKASSCRAPAPANNSNSSQRKHSSLIKGTKGQLRDDEQDEEYLEENMSQGGEGAGGAGSHARTLGNMSQRSGPGGAKSLALTHGNTSKADANSLAKTLTQENMDDVGRASVAASSRPVGKQSQAPAQAHAQHLKCCAKGEEGGKDCVLCKPYLLAGNGKGPVTIKYKAIIVDATPTLAKISEARFPLESSCSVAPSRAAPTVAVSRLADRSQVGDPIDNEFQDIVDNNMPMVWIFGYTQSSIVKNKAHCIDTIAAKNKLAVINLSSHVGYWLGPTPAANSDNDKSSKFGKSTATGASAVSKTESQLANLHDKIRARARKILHAHNVTGTGYNRESESESAYLPIEDICELLKLCMVSANNPSPVPSKSKAAVPPAPPSGFIIDNFPLCTKEGVEAEAILYKCMVCLYFSSVAWSLAQNKELEKEPLVIKPTYHLREEPYSEFIAEKGADFFGFKTIKVINAEDLEDMQITDINSLVRQHLEGNGLNLHKIMRKKGGGATGHQYTPSGKALTTVGLKSNIVMDHNDFLSQGNRTAAPSSVAEEVTSGQIEVPNLSREFSKKQLTFVGGGSQANSKGNKSGRGSGGGSGAFGNGGAGGGTSRTQVGPKSKNASQKLGSQVSGSGSYFSDSESMTEKSEVQSGKSGGKKQGPVQSPNYNSTPFKKKGKG